MKKISLYLILATILLVFTECNKNENAQWDTVNGQTLAAFKGTSVDLAVNNESGTGSAEITIDVTTSSSSERTISVEVVDDKTTATNNQFSFNNEVTIPANQYNTTLTVQGFSTDLLPNQGKELTLKLSSVENGIINTSEMKVNIFLVCPIPDDFMLGQYKIEQTSPFVDGPTLSDGSIVELVKVDNDTRSFSTETYPNFCSGSFLDFQFNLVCGEIIVPTQNTICRCSSVEDWFSPAETNSTYDLNDDNVFFVTFTDDTQSDCGSPTQTTYKFTKQ